MRELVFSYLWQEVPDRVYEARRFVHEEGKRHEKNKEIFIDKSPTLQSYRNGGFANVARTES